MGHSISTQADLSDGIPSSYMHPVSSLNKQSISVGSCTFLQSHMPPDGTRVAIETMHRQTTSNLETSPFHHLTCTNDPPSEVEEVELRAALKRDLALLEATKRRIESTKAILSPVRRLSRELIVEIVLHALGHYGTEDEAQAATFYPEEGPWSYSQVSRIWRDVVITYPKFWSVWRFDEDTISPKDVEDPEESLRMMHIIVQRSENEPLSVFLEDRTALKFTSPLFQCVLRASHRWKRAQLVCDELQSLKDLGVIHGKLPLLENVVLCTPWLELNRSLPGVRHFGDTDTLTVFEIAPRLHSVSLMFSVYRDGWQNFDLSFPWAQLTTYAEEFDSLSPVGHHRRMLSRLRNVVHCTLVKSVDNSESLSADSPIRLDCLRTLNTANSSVLHLLTLPSLEALEIGDATESAGSRDRLIAFFNRSQCRLQKLTLGRQFQDHVALIATLHRVPSIVSLSVESPYESKLLQSLILKARSDGHASLLPDLQYLSLWDRSPGGDLPSNVEKTFLKMLHSRSPGASDERQASQNPVFSLRVTFMNSGIILSKSFIQSCRELRKEGVGIVLMNWKDGPLL